MTDPTATMTTSLPPNTPGSRREVPSHPTSAQIGHLRDLLEQKEHWLLRGDWERYLATGNPALLVSISTLSRDQKAAARSWLEQQRHKLHRALEGGQRASDGWLESFPLFRALAGNGG